jgi:putative phosphoesterase
MLVAISDTHADSEPRLAPHLREALRNADLLLHAGDFVTEAVYDRFDDLADGLTAVRGNSDRRGLADRLPETATVEWAGLRFLLAHGHRHDETSLSFLARQEGADVVVTGHTHRPTVGRLGETVHVNPGSHAQPRGNRAAYAAFARDAGGVSVRLRAPSGAEFVRERV